MDTNQSVIKISMLYSTELYKTGSKYLDHYVILSPSSHYYTHFLDLQYTKITREAENGE